MKDLLLFHLFSVAILQGLPLSMTNNMASTIRASSPLKTGTRLVVSRGDFNCKDLDSLTPAMIFFPDHF